MSHILGALFVDVYYSLMMIYRVRQSRKMTMVTMMSKHTCINNDPHSCSSSVHQNDDDDLGYNRNRHRDEEAELAHEEHESGHLVWVTGCAWCEGTLEDQEYERQQPTCYSCGQPAEPGYIAGDWCGCGGALDTWPKRG